MFWFYICIGVIIMLLSGILSTMLDIVKLLKQVHDRLVFIALGVALIKGEVDGSNKTENSGRDSSEN